MDSIEIKEDKLRNILRGITVLYGNGVIDDTTALQAYINGEEVQTPDGNPVESVYISTRRFAISYRVSIPLFNRVANYHINLVPSSGFQGIKHSYDALNNTTMYAPFY